MFMDVHTLRTTDIEKMEIVFKGKLSCMEIRVYISLSDLAFMKGYSGSI